MFQNAGVLTRVTRYAARSIQNKTYARCLVRLNSTSKQKMNDFNFSFDFDEDEDDALNFSSQKGNNSRFGNDRRMGSDSRDGGIDGYRKKGFGQRDGGFEGHSKEGFSRSFTTFSPPDNSEIDDIFGHSQKSSRVQQVFIKDFYKNKELDEVRNRDPKEVEEHRKVNNMSIFGKNIPNPILSFAESTLDSLYVQQLEKMGLTTPTAIQSQGIPMALSGRDMIGVSKTGSGKTLAFILPAIVHYTNQPPLGRGDGPVVLVMAPTRELAQQINKEVENFSNVSGARLKTAVVFGGSNRSPQIVQLRNQPQIVIATPGRLLDFLECGATNLDRTTYVVLDEADRMLDMGFKDELERILSYCRPERQTLMFSATWPKDIQSIAENYMTDQIRVQIGSLELTANNQINQTFHQLPLGREKDRQFLRDVLRLMDEKKKVLVFSNTKANCDKLAWALNRAGVASDFLHGDRSQSQRDVCMERFRDGRTKVLVATDVCARGIDIRDISAVINYDMPTNVDSYVHRIGRTARANSKGDSIGYLNDTDLATVGTQLIDLLEKSEQSVPDFMTQWAERSKRFGNMTKSGGKPRGGSTQKWGQRSSFKGKQKGWDAEWA